MNGTSKNERKDILRSMNDNPSRKEKKTEETTKPQSSGRKDTDKYGEVTIRKQRGLVFINFKTIVSLRMAPCLCIAS